MNKAKTIKFIGSWKAFLLNVMAVYSIIWTILASSGVAPGLQIGIILAIISILWSSVVKLAGIYYSMKIQIDKASCQLIPSTDLETVTRLLRQSTELRIFATSSETYRYRLNSILVNRDITALKRIKILIREDGTEIRMSKVNDEIRKWNKEIQKIYDVQIEYALYKFDDIMLRGYIFDKSYAMLGWYLNIGECRLGNQYDLTLFAANSKGEKDVIEFASNTFERFFERGKYHP